MKVLVTGAGGFLGRRVVESLTRAGHDVRAIVRRTPNPPLDVDVQRFDLIELTRGADAGPLLQGTDAVVHLAGLVSRAQRDSAAMYRIHLEVTQRLLDASRDQRWVLASTSGTIAVSASDVGEMNESHQPDLEVIGRWPYYMSKFHQERAALRWAEAGHGEMIILNPSLLLGPGDTSGSSTQDVLDVLNRRHPASVPGTVSFVDVRDVAPVFERALRSGRSGSRYLLSGANMSVRRFVERVALLGGVAPPRVHLPAAVAHSAARWLSGIDHALGRSSAVDPVHVDIARHHWSCDASAARRVFDFTARDPQLTLRDTIQDLAARRWMRPT